MRFGTVPDVGRVCMGSPPNEEIVEKGRVYKRVSTNLPPEEWLVHIPDHHEGYIAWETYRQNRRSIGKNCARAASSPSPIGGSVPQSPAGSGMIE